MRLIQPKPDHRSPLHVPTARKCRPSSAVAFVRCRYPHHAAASGYDRICDYVDAPTVGLSDARYWAGETVMRPWALWSARTCGVFEYSRYDYVMESAVIADARRAKPRTYHFVYGEKGFVRSGPALKRGGHSIVLTVHHPEPHLRDYIRGWDHFRHVDRIITMDRATIEFWNDRIGRDVATWIPHGVDCDSFLPLDPRPVNSVPRIVFGGTHERDFEMLQKTVSELAAGGDIAFDLITRHPVAAVLAGRFSTVRCHQGISDERYRELLQQADVLFLPLRMSTACNVVLESLACGTPVVTTEGGVSDYVDASCSRVIAVGDATAAVAACQELLTMPAARTAARACALRHAWQRIAETHLKVYELAHQPNCSSTAQ